MSDLHRVLGEADRWLEREPASPGAIPELVRRLRDHLRDALGELEATGRRLACYDCGLPYGGPGWCDVIVPDDVWHKISPHGDEGGILCFNCIARHCAGMDDVPLKIVSGPFTRDR